VVCEGELYWKDEGGVGERERDREMTVQGGVVEGKWCMAVEVRRRWIGENIGLGKQRWVGVVWH